MNKEELKPVRTLKKNHTSLTGKVSNSDGDLNSFESSLERDFILLTNFDSNVEKFVEQPTKIEYHDEFGRLRHYTPDFLVFYRNKALDQPYYKPTLVEIKYSERLKKDRDILKPKFDAANIHCRKKGWEFKVVTEKDIRTDFLYNVKFLSGYLNSSEVKNEDINLLIDSISEMEIATPLKLIDSLSSEDKVKATLLYTIWYMLSNHLIGADLSIRLTMKSEIWSRI
ncbi:TnsA endonuclease N-terminal domain-containing protein [Ekhidna sp.]